MRNSLLALLLLLTGDLFAQNSFLVYLKDKNSNPYTINTPLEYLSQRSIDRRINQDLAPNEQDLPVSPFYIQSIKESGLDVQYCSKWLNACLAVGDTSNLKTVLSLPFITEIEPLDYTKGTINTLQKTATDIQYGNSEGQLTMLEIDQMHREGLTGKGILIAVLDGGFPEVDKLEPFANLQANNQVVGTYNFPDRKPNVYKDHEHGTMVLSTLGAFWEGKIIGAAYDAQYLLLRTENVQIESREEEFYWLLGAEYADSAGADIISSSLGYNTFDLSSQDYNLQDLDGQTALITRAAEWAFAKGMLVVNSAGNEGQSSWKYIIPPADGEHVLTVGGVGLDGKIYNSSSRGPTIDGRIKPDVMAVGQATTVLNSSGKLSTSNGTSFSAPLISGFAANLWQKFPHLSNIELLQLIRQSGDRAKNPDNNFGYGIPGYNKSLITMGINTNTAFPRIVNPADDILTINWDFADTFTCQLFDVTGRKVLEKSGLSHRINIGHIQTGAYIVRIVTADKMYRETIIIE